MASSMLKSIAIQKSTDISPQYFHFSDTKKMIYLIEQLVLCDYVTMFAGTLKQSPGLAHYEVAAPLNLRTYRNVCIERALAIPKNDFSVGKYVHYNDMLINLCRGNMPSADDLMDLLMDPLVLEEPALQIPYEFLLPFVFAVNGTKIAKDRLPSHTDPDEDAYTFYNPLLLVPEYEFSKEKGIRLLLLPDSDLQLPCFNLDHYTDLSRDMALPYRYIAALDWRGKNLSSVLGLLERFSLEHDSHVMQNDGICTIGDLCYDIVTQNNYCCHCTPYNFSAFISCCKYLCETWNVQVDDTTYFGELLKYGQGDPQIVNYLQKSTDEITTAEMEAFKSSVYASFIHKTISATEAADPSKDKDTEETKEKTEDPTERPVEDTDAQAGTSDTPTETQADTPAGEDPTALGDMGGDTGIDDTSGLGGDSTDTSGDTEENTPTKTVERKIPPAADGILLELLNPENETLSDHLYRKEFLVRVNDLLQNPSTAKCSSQTLFMLKEWATKWLYVFSVASLKSFLRNINFNLMVKQ